MEKTKEISTFDARPRLVVTDALYGEHVIQGADSYKDKNKTEIVETE